MRTSAPYINELWQRGGPFTGADSMPHGRVTVQGVWNDGLLYPELVLRPTMDNIGIYTSRGGPLRFFQKADDSQPEIEIPSVRSIAIDRSIDSGAATCQIAILNQRMDDPGEASSDTELGRPGYYTFDRGGNPHAVVRWGHQANPFWGLLAPNSILRTYQGYGGIGATIDEAVAAGNLLLTGVWFIDSVVIDSAGDIQIECRDPMKLLIEQKIYPPPVSRDGVMKYPLTYRRWTYTFEDVKASNKKITHVVPGDKRIAYADSSNDRWYGYNSNIHGHRGTDAVDGNPGSFWLSEGNSNPGRPFCVGWIEFVCGEDINSVWLHPWAGNYQIYISVMEHGVWQGTDVVPYDHTPLIGNQPHVVDTGADIPYVMTAGVPWETGQEYMLNRAYRAERVRLSFRQHTRSDWGPWHYRVGLREVKLRISGDGTIVSDSVPSIAFGAAPALTAGYWTVTDNDQVDVFGDATTFPLAAGLDDLHGGNIDFSNTIRRTKDGDGYWVLQNNGAVRAYGAAIHHGDFRTNDIAVASPDFRDVAFELIPTFDDGGYWITTNNGHIYAFGNAEDYVSTVPFINDVMLGTGEGHPTEMGLWLCNQAGVVYAYGAAAHLGNADATDKVTSIRATSTGDGYWIMDTAGKVYPFGDAWEDPAQGARPAPKDWFETYWDLMPAPDDLGYGILRGTGEIFGFGSFDASFGGPIPGTQAKRRHPGNYLDYADVIRDLALWAGFLLYEDGVPANEEPGVFGSIETTGAYSDEDLPIDMFDKRPFIDAMNEIKEIVAYLLYVDDDGSLIFTSPNWWAPGNFNELGERINVIPEIDELLQLTSYRVSVDDLSLTSEIVLSSEDPDQVETTTVQTRLVPFTAKALRGICKPFLWVNGYFQRQDELDLMAELIAMQTWFQQRLGSISCPANPCIQINDQVRVWERVTGETYIHYVRGVSTQMDLQTGDYSMTITTHWLGSSDNWAIKPAGSFEPEVIDDSTVTPILVVDPAFGVSEAAWAFVVKNQDKATNVVLGEAPLVVTSMTEGDPSGDDGAANP